MSAPGRFAERREWPGQSPVTSSQNRGNCRNNIGPAGSAALSQDVTCGIVHMSKRGITGHDEWVVTESLATALVALEQLEPPSQPRAHMDDIRKLLMASCQHGTVNLHLAQAKCRLFPRADRAAIYRNTVCRTRRYEAMRGPQSRDCFRLRSSQ
jgi:hypothetical protein